MILSWGQDIRWIAPPGTSIVGAGEDVDVGMGPWWLPVRAHHHIPSRGIAPRIPSFVVLLRCIGYLKCIGAYPPSWSYYLQRRLPVGFIMDGLDAETYDRKYADNQLVARIIGYFRPQLSIMLFVAVLVLLNSLMD